jgi:hypothetical protein
MGTAYRYTGGRIRHPQIQIATRASETRQYGCSHDEVMIGRTGSVSWRALSARFLGLPHCLTIDGEACVCGSDGVAVFAALHSGSGRTPI